MNVAVCRLTLRMPENQTLKGKRRTIHSLCARVRNKFNVSIAEVDDHQLWQITTLGISYISNEARHANQVLSRVVDYIKDLRMDLELVDYSIETMSGF